MIIGLVLPSRHEFSFLLRLAGERGGVVFALVGLDEVAKHDVLGALSLLYLIEPLSHIKHLHLDELEIDTLMFVVTTDGLILHIARILLKLVDT